jgi:ribosome-binding protein aMBF1 (putative translation factor)
MALPGEPEHRGSGQDEFRPGSNSRMASELWRAETHCAAKRGYWNHSSWRFIVIIGERLRALREEKKFSQGDIEKRTELIRCDISRVGNGRTIPAIETLEKMARALEMKKPIFPPRPFRLTL